MLVVNTSFRKPHNIYLICDLIVDAKKMAKGEKR